MVHLLVTDQKATGYINWQSVFPKCLGSNFVDCESSLESNSPNILALCETNLGDSSDSGNFPVRRYLPLIRKDASTHMEGRTSFCTGLIFRKLSRFLLRF